MTRMPRVTGTHVVRSLRKVGFEVVRQRGSHVVMKHPDGRGTVVPIHGGETIGVGLMSKIRKDVEIDRETFIGLLGN
ncbi:MAG: type II toxin-antitoxin system HicA family toxin [Gemmatimonadetes bacterium]|nr:type II toxin-antitoxin system HicA family toxin [Gemmatimonadota bacterium]MYB56252.1 type II toxin-antitoxin system HicA family toxin [Gemmatimonadota bacterium]